MVKSYKHLSKVPAQDTNLRFLSQVIAQDCPNDDGGVQRFRDLGTFRASMELSCKNLPWLNRIHVVVPREQAVDWLRADKVEPNDCNQKVNLVYVENLVPKFSQPNHCSHIEASIGKIPGLAENFIYLNDDMMFLHPVKPSDLFTEDQKPRFIASQASVNTARTYAQSPYYPSLPHSPFLYSLYLDHMPYVFRKSWFDGLEKIFPQNMNDMYHAKCRSDLKGGAAADWELGAASRLAFGDDVRNMVPDGFVCGLPCMMYMLIEKKTFFRQNYYSINYN
jgi:hypothetical protein